MAALNAGLVADALFVGATRPPTRWGVTYSALLWNMVITLETFLLTKNLLTLLMCAPIHGVCALLCARDARFFALLRTHGFVERLQQLTDSCHGVIRWSRGDARREP